MSMMMLSERHSLRMWSWAMHRECTVPFNGGSIRSRVTPLRTPPRADQDILAAVPIASYTLIEQNEDLLLAARVFAQ
jgi:hypothetical protein